MARNYSVNWRALRYRFTDAAEYVADRKGRFIALALVSAMGVMGYNTVNDPEFIARAEQERKTAEAQSRQLQEFAAQAQVRGPGQAATTVGALSYMFDFNTKKVVISGENGTQEVSFDSVFKGELEKKVKEAICGDAARRDHFGLHYCQQ